MPQGDSNSKQTRRTNRGSSGSSVSGLGSVLAAEDLGVSRELPHNIDAEEGVIASMILDNEVITNCIAQKVRENYFYSPRNRKIFSSIMALFMAGKPVDMIVLANRLSDDNELAQIGGIEELSRISGRIETHANYRHWLDIVREKYFLRELIGVCAKTIEGAYTSQGELDVFIEGVEQKVLGISQDRVTDSVKKAGEQVDGAVKLINNMIVNRGELTGVPTGFTALDNLMRGLQKNEMIVIAGRPGTGKTSIALNMVESAIFHRKRFATLIFSLEMGAEQLYMRMISSRARVDQHSLREGYVPKTALHDINKAAGELKDSPLWIDDTADMNILEMRAKARRLQQQLLRKGERLGLIVVDYLQLLKGMDSRAPREQQVAEMSRGMKAMAKEMGVPVVVLAQLNRESEKEGSGDPKASQLRESGSIEQDADVILLLSWQKKSATPDAVAADSSQRLVKVEIAKQRNGPTDYVNLIFNRNFTRYENYLKQKDDA